MTYEILIGGLTFFGMLAVVVKPVINLNNSITSLTGSVDALKDMIAKLEKRIDSHSEDIDEINVGLADHEARLKNLER